MLVLCLTVSAWMVFLWQCVHMPAAKSFCLNRALSGVPPFDGCRCYSCCTTSVLFTVLRVADSNDALFAHVFFHAQKGKLPGAAGYHVLRESTSVPNAFVISILLRHGDVEHVILTQTPEGTYTVVQECVDALRPPMSPPPAASANQPHPRGWGRGQPRLCIAVTTRGLLFWQLLANVGYVSTSSPRRRLARSTRPHPHPTPIGVPFTSLQPRSLSLRRRHTIVPSHRSTTTLSRAVCPVPSPPRHRYTDGKALSCEHLMGVIDHGYTVGFTIRGELVKLGRCIHGENLANA
jgi:hypothetical protein